MKKIVDSILSLTKTGKMQIRINTLENELETLKSTVKDELYKTFMAKINEPMEVERYKADNKALRKKVKILKEMLKEEHKQKEKNKKNGNRY